MLARNYLQRSILSTNAPMFPEWDAINSVPTNTETVPSRLPYSSSENKNKSRGLDSKSRRSSAANKKSSNRNASSFHKRKAIKRDHLAFADYDIVFPIPHFRDMSEQEIRDCWMSAADLRDIRRSCIGTVRDMNHGEPPEGIFLRGLDQHSDKYVERKDEISDQIYHAVFRIQEFQRISGKDASEVMAKCCAKFSEPSVVAAHMAAISDMFSAHKGTWSHRAIPDAAVFEEQPEEQGAYKY
ncbi:hypothetical protein IV203_037181 [Nitzschia inconspicua]|uniref:Uncharacterized protein n=1 Tax=Nitzschia inconspicua TaxID=303405 RepID=A0A9K3LKA2_9STRA|nr:hypothetical protein IV203_037181 [Nitzschia inconspicua]